MKFDRVYRFVIGTGNDAVEFNNLDANIPAFQIEFEIDKTHSDRPNEQKVSIYNLSDETIKRMSRVDNLCELYAGYRNDAGALLLAAGSLTHVVTTQSNGDRITHVQFYDGWQELRDTTVSLSYSKGASAHTVIKRVASSMGLPLLIAPGAPNLTWKSGFSYQGTAHGALTKACAAAGLEWSIQNRTIQVTSARGTTQRQAVLISAESGLIGSPEEAQQSALEKTDKSTGAERRKKAKNTVSVVSTKAPELAYQVKVLLTPQINPSDIVVIKSKFVNGTFRAKHVKHQGSLYAGEWCTHLQVIKDDGYRVQSS